MLAVVVLTFDFFLYYFLDWFKFFFIFFIRIFDLVIDSNWDDNVGDNNFSNNKITELISNALLGRTIVFLWRCLNLFFIFFSRNCSLFGCYFDCCIRADFSSILFITI